jgi:hypothetical protein
VNAASEGGRFDRLEPSTPPARPPAALPQAPRFGQLEIGEQGPPPEVPAGDVRILCAHCGRPNERQSELCWACGKPVTPLPGAAAAPDKPAPGQPVQLVLDGQTYRSDDPGIPADIRVLIERVRKEGYTPELLGRWREWRATRNSPKPAELPAAAPGPVLRVDGRLYRPGDREVPPELKAVFDYIQIHGVTPELLETLRASGGRVKLRPRDSAVPSDGDLAFWGEASRLEEGGASANPSASAVLILFVLLAGVFAVAALVLR